MDETAHFDSVAKFIEQETGFPRNQVKLDTSLFGDVGLDGEDAERFFMAFGERFGVSLDTLHLNKHFGGEGLSIAGALTLPVRLLSCLWKRGQANSELQPIRVEDLLNAIDAKQWP